MKTLRKIRQNPRIYGAYLGGLSATLGSLIFSILEIVNYGFVQIDYIRTYPGRFINLSETVILISWIYSLFPGIFGGYFLICMYQFKKIKEWLSPKKGFLVGLIVGVLIGFILTLPPILFTRAEGDNDTVARIFLIRIGEVMVITGIASGWSGWRLARFLLQP